MIQGESNIVILLTFIGLPTTFTAPPAVVLTVKLSVSLSTGA
jgi:hypothetical protein